MNGERGLAVRSENDLSTNWNKNLAVADQMVKTGFLPKQIRTAQQAVLVMETGRELGLPPMEAIRNIFIVDNKTALASQLMLSLLYKSEKLEDIKIDDTDKKCTVMMKRKGMSPYTVTFSLDDARNAGLNYKDNWKKYPKNMCRARAISMCARVVAPDVIAGIYTPEEIEAHLDNEEIAVTVEKSEEMLQGEKYQEHYSELMFTIREELPKITDPEKVNLFKRSIDTELKQLIDADRLVAEETIATRYSELVTGNTPKTKLDQYREGASTCKTGEELMNYFKNNQEAMMRDLNKKELAQVTEHCQNYMAELNAKEEVPEVLPPEEKAPEVIVCQNGKCGTVINDPRVVEYSKKNFMNKIFCRRCQDLARQK